MNFFLRIAIFFLIQTSVFSQITFQKTYGGIKAENNECLNKSTGMLTTTLDGGYAICNTTYSYGKGSPQYQASAYFLKLNQFGDTLFTRALFSDSVATI